MAADTIVVNSLTYWQFFRLIELAMPRPPSDFLTEREAQIMDVLWSQGHSTAEAVRLALPDEPHDSTVRTLLRVLKDKGCVRVVGRNPAAYEPLVSREQAQSTATQSLLARLFQGAADALVLRLLEDEQLTTEQLAELRKKIKTRKRKGGT
jgi:BlaI family transcriptional regulator, penicillinase repressor